MLFLSQSSFVCLGLVFFALGAYGAVSGPVIVSTTYGPVMGTSDEEAGSRSFKGIPYAAPPVDTLRWASPQPPQPWSDPLNASVFAAGCPQDCDLPPHTCPLTLSESCLYLNVYTPLVVDPKTPLPVMVFFHGGNFQFGSSGAPVYDGVKFVGQGQVVLVTVSYRLGILGFLADYDNFDGNFGLQDQRMALQWVQDNIGNFGGNTNLVTIFGQSAGAMSVACHMASPKSVGLFHRAIMESDPFSLPIKSKQQSLMEADVFYSLSNCTAGDVACLKALSWQQIVEAQMATAKKLFFLHPLDVFIPFTPTWDSTQADLPLSPIDAFAQGKYSKVPAIIGHVNEDGRLFIYRAAPGFVTDADYLALIGLVFGRDAPSVLAHYPPTPIRGDKRDFLSMFTTQYIFECSSRYAAQLLAKNNAKFAKNVFIFQFNHSMVDDVWGPLYPYCYGHVCHGAELPFVFNPPMETYNVTFTPVEQILSSQMIAYWTNFAYSGDPNKGPSQTPMRWPSFTNSSHYMMEFMTPANDVYLNYQESVCNYWDSMGYRFGW